VVALALGIGANVSCFVAVNGILLHPYSYPNLDRIMTVQETLQRAGLQNSGVAPADFADWQQRNRSFEQLAAYRSWPVNLTGADRPVRVEASRVTSNFFQVFGTKPRIGRVLSESESQPGNNRVAVLSEGFWRTRFGAAQNVLGKTISLAGQTYSVIGVMPEDFDYPLATDVWVPLILTPAENTERVYHNLLVVGLLKPNVTPNLAKAEMQTIALTLGREYPSSNEGWGAAVTPLSQMTEQVTSQFIRVLFVAAMFLLLLAGANVANIQLARTTNRRRTLAIEAALGASRSRLARSLCAESILLSLTGGAIAVAAAAWMGDLNSTTIPAEVYHWVPGLRHLQIDSTVVLFTVALSLLTGILCSIPAILHLLGRQSYALLSEALSQGNRTVAGDRRNRLRNILVVCEVAMALLLLVGAGVMVNTFQHMTVLNPGFNPSNLLTAQISLPPQEYRDDVQSRGFFDRLLPELSTISNVKSVSAEGGMGEAADFAIKNRPAPDAGEPKPDVRVVGDRYFQTMELPMISGRAITDQDVYGSPPVIIVSRSIAEHYWPGADPAGQQIHFGQSPWMTVVGVSGDTVNWFTNEPEPAVYVPYRQVPSVSMELLLRTTGDPALITNALISRVRSADASEPIYQIKSMDQFFFEARSGVQAAARTMIGNAVIALFLAVSGIYGVIAYFVSQRTREIGVRIALGAANPDILKMTLGQASRVAGLGLAIGVPAAYVLMRLLSHALYNVVVVKWTTFAGVTAVLAIAALLAAYLPARRALAVDPVIALRNE
jgi:putative ABC transport system permease protein